MIWKITICLTTIALIALPQWTAEDLTPIAATADVFTVVYDSSGGLNLELDGEKIADARSVTISLHRQKAADVQINLSDGSSISFRVPQVTVSRVEQ
jgi:ribosomal protein S4E